MNSKKITIGFFVAFVAIACTKDEILYEKENSFQDTEVTNYLIENETSLSGKSGTNTHGRDSDVFNDNGRLSPLSGGVRPLCTEIREGDYYPVLVTYSNFSTDNYYVRTHAISSIRSKYNVYYNYRIGDCKRIIFPPDFDSITCEGETCSEIWYFFESTFIEVNPEGGGTLDIDVEAPGP